MGWSLHLHKLYSRSLPWDLFFRPTPEQARPAAGDVTFRWLGTAGFEVEAGGRRLLIDPYLSRHPMRQFLWHPMAPDEDVIRRHVDGADVIFAGHSHHDHGCDVGAIARHTGAQVYASESSLKVARVFGARPEQLHHIAADDVVQDGPFDVKVLRSVHGKLFAGRMPAPGRIGDVDGPLRLAQWRVGATFGLHITVGGVSCFHLGSADFVESALTGVQCDVLMLCIVGRGGSPDYTGRILRALRPKVVLPCHWDNFFLPFDVPPRAMPSADVERFFEEVEASGVRTEVALLDFFGAWRVRAPARD
jgi:L-ascorbate metabolism protein UlaG (beta-lactamase superfamily)